jgi:hypothetical protein
VTSACYVINTGLAHTPGEHWVALYVNTHVVYYFDSLGFTPFYDPYIHAIVKSFNIKNLMYNNLRIQGLTSNVCGQYCIYFIHAMSRKKTYQDFLSLFDPCNNLHNDVLVCKFIRKKFLVEAKCQYN